MANDLTNTELDVLIESYEAGIGRGQPIHHRKVLQALEELRVRRHDDEVDSVVEVK